MCILLKEAYIPNKAVSFQLQPYLDFFKTFSFHWYTSSRMLYKVKVNALFREFLKILPHLRKWYMCPLAGSTCNVLDEKISSCSYQDWHPLQAQTFFLYLYLLCQESSRQMPVWPGAQFGAWFVVADRSLSASLRLDGEVVHLLWKTGPFMCLRIVTVYDNETR